MKYSVETLRAAGLEARWTKTRGGSPILTARWPGAPLAHQRNTWWTVGAQMWREMAEAGVVEGFDRATLLGDVFSLGGAK